MKKTFYTPYMNGETLVVRANKYAAACEKCTRFGGSRPETVVYNFPPTCLFETGDGVLSCCEQCFRSAARYRGVNHVRFCSTETDIATYFTDGEIIKTDEQGIIVGEFPNVTDDEAEAMAVNSMLGRMAVHAAILISLSAFFGYLLGSLSGAAQ